tara:strand:+ start:1870 stop:2694 length:825 start_codon:yes stop_codon:yes gene_type:complete
MDAKSKKKRKKAKKKAPVTSQKITQKVVVNVGSAKIKEFFKAKSKAQPRTGTQNKRNVVPQPVVYQNNPIPLQPNYSTQLNDLRNEVKRQLSHNEKEEGRRRAVELRVEEGKQGTSIQTQTQDAPRVRTDIPPAPPLKRGSTDPTASVSTLSDSTIRSMSDSTFKSVQEPTTTRKPEPLTGFGPTRMTLPKSQFKRGQEFARRVFEQQKAEERTPPPPPPPVIRRGRPPMTEEQKQQRAIQRAEEATGIKRAEEVLFSKLSKVDEGDDEPPSFV